MIPLKDGQVLIERSTFHKCHVQSCRIAFLEASSLPSHLEYHENMFSAHVFSSYVKIKKTEIFECDNCRQGFLSKNKFLLHRLKHRNNNVYVKESDSNRTNDKVKLYKCPECDYEFVAKSTLEAHSICHQPFPYICHCGIGYYQLQDLKSHKKLIHPPIPKAEDVKPISNDILLSKTNITSPAKKRRRTNGPKVKADTFFRRTLETHPPLDVEFQQNNDGRYLCPHCLKTFAAKSNAELHYRAIHRGERPHICQICGKAFTQSAVLKTHLLIHSGIRAHQCQYCEKSFVTYHNRILHERTHTGEKPYKCSVCEKAFSDPSAYNCHKRIHTGEKIYVCEQCPKAFTHHSALNIHRKRHFHERNFTCQKCEKKFYTKSDLRMHFEVIHEYKNNYQCDYCSEEFGLKHNLVRHIKGIHLSKKTHSCDVCLKKFKQEYCLKKHMINAHSRKRDYTCKVCCKQFIVKCQLEEHSLKHSDVKKFECDHCSKKCYSKRMLRNHIVSQHVTKVRCKICKRYFTCMSDLKQHRLKIGEVCDICGKIFFCKGEVLVHHNKTHARLNTLNRYECDDCGRVFSKYDSIKRHILYHHSVPKLICDHCGKRFALKESIRSHMMTYHLEVLRCNICYKRFYSTFELRNHKKAGCTPTVYTCEICNKTFSYYYKMQAHLSIHAGNRKKYKCPLCAKEVLFKSFMRHIRLMHCENR